MGSTKTHMTLLSSNAPTPTPSHQQHPTPSNASRASLVKWLHAIATTTRERGTPITTEESRVSTATSVLRLPDVDDSPAVWPTSARSGSALFIRPCYDVLYVLATSFMACREDEHHVVLTGSHGVGKRSFLSYLLYRLRRWTTPPRIVLDLPGLFALVDSDGHVEIGTRSTSFQAELCERQTFYLCDAMDAGRAPLCEAYLHAKSVVVMPPIASVEEAFKPSPQRLTFVMPAWSQGEMVACRDACYSHVSPEELQERQELWGGLVKWVLAESKAVSRAQFTRSVGLLTLDQAAKLASSCGYVQTPAEMTEAHLLVQMDAEANDTFQLRAAFLCSRQACAQVVDASLTKDEIVQFLQQHRASLRVQELVEQVEMQFMRRILLI